MGIKLRRKFQIRSIEYGYLVFREQHINGSFVQRTQTHFERLVFTFFARLRWLRYKHRLPIRREEKFIQMVAEMIHTPFSRVKEPINYYFF